MKRILFAFTALWTFAFVAAPAWAATEDPPLDPAGPVTPENTLASVQISAAVVTILVGTVIPVVSGFISKADSKFTGIATIVLNAISSVLVTSMMADGTAVISQQTFITFVTGLIGSLAMYYQVWRPLNITNKITPLGQPNGVLADKGRT